MRKTNKHAQRCDVCGSLVEAGQGEIWKCAGEDGCSVHLDGPGAWHCVCQDRQACRTRDAEDKAHLLTEAAAERALCLALNAIREEFWAGEYPDPAQGQVWVEGEEIALDDRRTRLYGGGTWCVIEPEGERLAPDHDVLEAARVEQADRQTLLDAAEEALVGWGLAHLPPPPVGTWDAWSLRFVDPGLIKALPTKDQDEYGRLCEAVRTLTDWEDPNSAYRAEKEVKRLDWQAWRASYPRSIWYVQNNGSDGDNWAASNVRTGGAGAIGHRLPWSAELEARVRALGVAK